MRNKKCTAKNLLEALEKKNFYDFSKEMQAQLELFFSTQSIANFSKFSTLTLSHFAEKQKQVI